MHIAPRVILGAAALSLALAGCGGEDVVDRDGLQTQVETQREKSVGQQGPKAECPDELQAEAGATTRCSMKFPDGTLGITVKVKSKDDDKVQFDIQADDELKK